MLVVYKENITQRSMDDVESHVGAPLFVIAVVLDQRIQKHRRRKSIVKPRQQQILRHSAFREADVVVRVLKRCCELVIEPESSSRQI